jgi:sugar phosphate isomerase/epimerase
MMIGSAPLHVTYTTNVHPAERWSEVRAILDRCVLPIRRRVAPGRRFGLGLRLSGRAAMDLAAPDALAELREWLARHDVYVFTLNGGPYGRFQGPPIKTAAYRPDWLDEERIRYTDRLANILARLLPPGVAGTINTIGGAFRARVRSRVDDAAIADRILRHVAVLVELYEKRGTSIALALEPEPACRLETIGETVEFFDRHLYSRAAVTRLAALTRLGAADASEALRRHLGVCLDAGHVAVEFEEPVTGLRALELAGVPVLKVQPTAAIAIRYPFDRHVRHALQVLGNDVCLHQVVARSPDRLRRYVDLPLALAAPPPDATEWRVHAHAALASDRVGPLGTTRRQASDLLRSLGRLPLVRQLEVETYTWGAQRHDAVDGIVRDLEWTLGSLTDVAKSA